MFTDLRIPADRRPVTRTEARISTILGTIFSLMILAALLDEFEAKKLSVLFLILFWIPMLVVHELGHALMAKALGWRVREIVIGFGRDLWHWRIGETHIKVKLAPVEGYVLPAPAESDRVRLKSALIYAAGPGAELLVLGLMLIVFGWDGVFGAADDLLHIALQSLAVVILIGAGFNLLPFRTEGAVSDGLGILSSPFMPESAIQLRLITFELREAGRLLDAGRTSEALRLLETQQARFPDNPPLQMLFAQALSADGQADEARALIRGSLEHLSENDELERGWLTLQAQVELDATEPDHLTMDLALQKTLAKSPNAPDLLAIKGASLVRRGRSEEGGDLLADAWRRNDGSADTAMMLAWLTIAAHRCRNPQAAMHYRAAFDHVNRSAPLKRLLEESLEPATG